MPKRKSDSREDFNYLSKKLKKLERKIKQRRYHRHVRVSVSSTDSDSSTLHNQQESKLTAVDDYAGPYDDLQPGCSYWDSAPITQKSYVQVPTLIQPPVMEEPVTPDNPSADLPTEQIIITEPLLEATTISQPEQVGEAEQVLQPDVQELDPDLIKILGEDPTIINEFGSEIQKDLAIRLNHITTSGLSKDSRKELKEKYLVPSNCKFIKAPGLNPEVRASLVESQAKRDKGIENKQTLTSLGLSSLSQAITHLLTSGYKDQKLLQLLMDTARILGDIQHSDSISRRLFILSTLKKDLKEQLEKTKIDEMLFGNNLAETLKSAKTIIESGTDLRSSSTMKSTVQKTTKAINRPLNYRAPPVIRRPQPPGGARYVRPVPTTPAPRQSTRTTYSSGSKTSSRQPQTRQRR